MVGHVVEEHCNTGRTDRHTGFLTLGGGGSQVDQAGVELAQEGGRLGEPVGEGESWDNWQVGNHGNLVDEGDGEEETAEGEDTLVPGHHHEGLDTERVHCLDHPDDQTALHLDVLAELILEDLLLQVLGGGREVVAAVDDTGRVPFSWAAAGF